MATRPTSGPTRPKFQQMLFGNRVIDISCRKAQEEVEKAVSKWGRYRLALDKYTADLVIGVRKGTGKAANPTINGGPVDTRPGTIETTDNQIRIGAQQGRPPDLTRQGTPPEPAHAGMEVGAEDDTFLVFQGGGLQYPLDNAPVWRYIAKDGLKSPRVEAVEEFREESEKAAAQKQQRQQEQGQKKVREADTALAPFDRQKHCL